MRPATALLRRGPGHGFQPHTAGGKNRLYQEFVASVPDPVRLTALAHAAKGKGWPAGGKAPYSGKVLGCASGRHRTQRLTGQVLFAVGGKHRPSRARVHHGRYATQARAWQAGRTIDSRVDRRLLRSPVAAMPAGQRGASGLRATRLLQRELASALTVAAPSSLLSGRPSRLAASQVRPCDQHARRQRLPGHHRTGKSGSHVGITARLMAMQCHEPVAPAPMRQSRTHLLCHVEHRDACLNAIEWKHCEVKVRNNSFDKKKMTI
jgi:hypothetical protein